MNTNDPVFLAEEEHYKVFPVHIGKISLEYCAGISRTADLLVVAWYPTFLYQRDAKNRSLRETVSVQPTLPFRAKVCHCRDTK
jgi:hypothetical protein